MTQISLSKSVFIKKTLSHEYTRAAFHLIQGRLSALYSGVQSREDSSADTFAAKTQNSKLSKLLTLKQERMGTPSCQS